MRSVTHNRLGLPDLISQLSNPSSPRWISYPYSIFWCSAGTTCVHNPYISTSFFFHILHRVNWKWNILSYLWIITFICSSSSTWPFIQSFNYSINQVMKFFVSISCWCQNIILFGIKIRSLFFIFYHIFYFN